MKATRQILAAALLAASLFSATSARAVSSWAQSYGSQATAIGDQYHGSGVDGVRGLAKMPDGGFVAVGQLDLPLFQSPGLGHNASGALVRYAPDGSIVWQKVMRVNNTTPINSTQVPLWSYIDDVKTDASGNIYVCGLLFHDQSNATPALAKLNSTGNIIWQNGVQFGTWAQPDPNPALVRGLTEFGELDITADGGAIAVASVNNTGNTHTMPVVVKFDGTGHLSWMTALDNSTQYSGATSVCTASDGSGYFVSIGGHPDGSTTILKLDLAGNKTAEKVFLADAVRSENPVRLLATPDGGCVNLSNVRDGIGKERNGLLLRKLSGSLDNQMEKVFRLPEFGSRACSIEPMTGGGWVIGCHTDMGIADSSAVVLRVSAAGAVLSATKYGGANSEAVGDVYGGCSAVQLPDGSFALLSSTFTFDSTDPHYKTDWWVVKTDTNRQIAGFAGRQEEVDVGQIQQIDDTFPGSNASEYTAVSPNALTPIANDSASFPNVLAFVMEDLATKVPPNAPIVTLQAFTLPSEIAVEQPAGTNINTGGGKDFGNVNVGASTSLTFTIKNTGLGDLQLSGTPKVGVGGADATMFSVTTQPASPVAANTGSTTFVVQFSPTSAGAKSAALSIVNNDSDESPFVINVSGTGVAVPEIAVESPLGTDIATGSTKSFGSVGLGSSSATQTFTVKNVGTATLSGLSLSIDGTAATDFNVGNLGATSLAPNATASFTVFFFPGATGARTAAIHIASNDADENPFNITLSGTGLSSNANLANLTTNAGSLPFTSNTPSYSMTVLNAVTSITLTPTVADSSATVKVNNATVASGNASAPINLAVGSNTITTIITAQDGTTTKTYTLVVSRGSGADTKAQITSPANGSALVSTSLPLVWNAGVNVTSCYLFVGTVAGGSDLYAGDQGTTRNRTITNLPADKKIYVTLYSLIRGAYLANYYVFNPLPSAKATVLSPASGSTLTSSALNLSWTPGVGVSRYYVYIGSSSGGYDLAAVDAGTATSRSFTVPQDGGPVYVTLWSLINGAFQSDSAWFTTALPVSGNRAAILTSPANASTLSSATVNLAWDAGVGATSYALWVGSTPDGYDLYSGLEGTNRSKNVNVPADGRRIYVTLHTLIGAGYQSNAYYFTAPTLPDAGAAQITAPANGSTLANSNLPLTWSAAAGATQYYLFVGNSPGASDLYAGSQGTTLTRTVTGMPVDGRVIYVTLYSWINNAWKTSSAWFTTANTATGNKRALITSPVNGATLSAASTTFTWGGGSGMTQYALWIGSSAGAYDLWASSENVTTTSRLVTLPTDGRKIYVTLYSFISGAWQGASYIYTATNIATTKAAMTSPVNGSVFAGASQTFNWSASNATTAYALWIGRTPGGYDIYSGAEGTNLTRTVTTLPTDGGPVYVTLYSLIKGAWQSNEYIYQAALP